MSLCLTQRKNHLYPYPVRAETVGIVTARRCYALGYIRNTLETDIICEPCYLQSNYNEAYRAAEFHGFFDGYLYMKYCNQCGCSK